MSTIIADNLTGKTSAGDITVTSEGGAATQSLQQGLAKAWANWDGTSPSSFYDSFSQSALTDNGTGDFTCNHLSNFSTINYVLSGSAQAIGGGKICIKGSTTSTDLKSTSQCRVNTAAQTTSYDIVQSCALFHGDLA
jgi:hypothetical protein